MMKNALFKDDVPWKAKISWTEPVLYDDLLDDEDCVTKFDLKINDNDGEDDFLVKEFNEDINSNFYMILGQWGQKKRLFYIGKTETPSVIDRLKQIDHKNLKKKLEKKFTRHKLLISLGDLYMGIASNITSQRVDDIESLLIYANDPECNEHNVLDHSVKPDYWIKNYGCYKPLYRQLHYGLMGD